MIEINDIKEKLSNEFGFKEMTFDTLAKEIYFYKKPPDSKFIEPIKAILKIKINNDFINIIGVFNETSVLLQKITMLELILTFPILISRILDNYIQKSIIIFENNLKRRRVIH